MLAVNVEGYFIGPKSLNQLIKPIQLNLSNYAI